jgi:hypothetical protein
VHLALGNFGDDRAPDGGVFECGSMKGRTATVNQACGNALEKSGVMQAGVGLLTAF